METSTQALKKDEAFGLLYVANFVLSFHLYFVVYINSSFLSTFIEERFVGTIYIIASILGIVALLIVSNLLRKFGNYHLLLYFAIAELLIFLGLAFLNTVVFILPIFIVYLALYPLILYNLDIFIESFIKKENTTGSIRGAFLTITNTALILAPLVAGFILTNGDFGKIYLISSLFLIPFLLIIVRFRNFKDPVYHNLNIKETFLCVKNDKKMYNIFMSHFLMRFFFSWMVIYMPIYLTQHIGFTWAEFGILTFIVLLPFALLEWPAGRIADKFIGEKELLSVGFIIVAFFISFVSFIETTDFLFWVAVLFAVRIGASLIEIMTESYFFKHVGGDDNSTISFFRITRPVAYILGPIVATVALQFLDFQYIWLILGIITLYGLRYSLTLEDTR